MKKLTFAFAALLLGAVSAQAGEFDGFYIGGEGAYTSSKAKEAGIERDKGYDASVYAGYGTTIKEKIYLGGEIDFTYGGFEHSKDGETLKNEFGAGVTAKAGYVVTPTIVAYGLVGYDAAKVELSGERDLAHGVKYGAGVESYLWDDLTVRSEIAQTRWKADDIKVNDVRTSVGLSYRF